MQAQVGATVCRPHLLIGECVARTTPFEALTIGPSTLLAARVTTLPEIVNGPLFQAQGSEGQSSWWCVRLATGVKSRLQYLKLWERREGLRGCEDGAASKARSVPAVGAMQMYPPSP
jgi:hypothetical protein